VDEESAPARPGKGPKKPRAPYDEGGASGQHAVRADALQQLMEEGGVHELRPSENDEKEADGKPDPSPSASFNDEVSIVVAF